MPPTPSVFFFCFYVFVLLRYVLASWCPDVSFHFTLLQIIAIWEADFVMVGGHPSRHVWCHVWRRQGHTHVIVVVASIMSKRFAPGAVTQSGSQDEPRRRRLCFKQPEVAMYPQSPQVTFYMFLNSLIKRMALGPKRGGQNVW